MCRTIVAVWGRIVFSIDDLDCQWQAASQFCGASADHEQRRPSARYRYVAREAQRWTELRMLATMTRRRRWRVGGRWLARRSAGFRSSANDIAARCGVGRRLVIAQHTFSSIASISPRACPTTPRCSLTAPSSAEKGSTGSRTRSVTAALLCYTVLYCLLSPLTLYCSSGCSLFGTCALCSRMHSVCCAATVASRSHLSARK